MNPNQGDSSPVRFNPHKDSSYSSSDYRTRPSGSPKSSKDFGRVLSKKDKSDEDEEATAAVDDEAGSSAFAELAELGQKKGPPSLFDLTSARTAKFPGDTLLPDKNAAAAATLAASQGVSQGIDAPTTNATKKSDIAMRPQGDPNAASPSQVFSKLSKELDNKQNYADDDASSFSAKKNEPLASHYVNEQPDISYINLMANNQTVQNTAATNSSKQILPAANVQAIIDQLVDKVQEMKYDGKTDTTMTLKNPPLLAGANLIVTSFDNAKGEFNISFENLSQAAKAVLDQQANQNSLREALVEKGYAVHIVTTTTLNENAPIITDAGSREQARRDREGRDGREGREQRR